MQQLRQLVTFAAYAALGYLGWSMAELARCKGGEGCLGYALHFWLGAAAAAFIFASGSVTWVVARRRNIVTTALSIALLMLLLGVGVIVVYLILHR